MAVRRTRAAQPQTTEQRLAAVIKAARDVMRVDPGLNGDLDRIPQLAWLLFLKALDDLEDVREVAHHDYKPILPERLRWRTWARNQRLTGDELIEFVNDDLLPKLRALQGKGQARTQADTLRGIFLGMDNRMRSGAQLRLLVNKLDEIHFTLSDDIHTMAYLYESMLRQMRDAAGDGGEFYTPRPVIRFMVKQTAPQMGETILDPAAGTGGFLVEALAELAPSATSTDLRNELHRNLKGVEKKALPYLLGTMNLMLHGVDSPALVLDNALTFLRDGSRKTRVNVILTNPPFGATEPRDVITSFPKGMQSAETAWMFLTTIIEKLRDDGRCAVVVPHSVLFDKGATATAIKRKLLETCDVHTIVRLPEGVFAPYTPIPANLLFFEKGRPTEQVWFYEVLPPDGQKRYTKTKPMRDEEFAEVQAWWGGSARAGRTETERAWSVHVDSIRAADYDLDLRNPHSKDELAHRPQEELISEAREIEDEMTRLLSALQATVGGGAA